MNIKHEDSMDDFASADYEETKLSKRLLYYGDPVSSAEEEQPLRKRQKIMGNKKKDQDLSAVKVKTLAEIRAEKQKQEHAEDMNSPTSQCAAVSQRLTDSEITISEVSSTSKMEEDENIESNEPSPTFAKPTREKSVDNMQDVRKKPKLRRTRHLQPENVVSSIEENVDNERNTAGDISSAKHNTRENVRIARGDSVDSSKLDEMLLLDEEDFECSNVSLQAEEDLLKDIDDILCG